MNRKQRLWACAAMVSIVALVVVFACAHSGGLADHTLRYDGLKRDYILFQPSDRAEHTGQRPLLLVLHGGGGTNQNMLRLTDNRFNLLAERDGFFVVYPQGFEKSWNDGRRDKISKAHRSGIDDVGFLKA